MTLYGKKQDEYNLFKSVSLGIGITLSLFNLLGGKKKIMACSIDCSWCIAEEDIIIAIAYQQE